MIIGGLIVIALFAALIAPWFIDWTAYRTAFEREATRVLGQPVRVGGSASVRILPMPSVTFTDLTVGEHGDGTPMMTVDAFSLNAELMPLLSGELRIVDMTLTRPVVTVVVGEGGAIAWTERKEMLVDPDKILVERLNVVDGSLRIEGLAGGRTIRGEGIAATLQAQSLIGPWRIDAAGLFDGVASSFLVSTGRVQQDGSVRIKTVARRSGLPYRLTLDGPVALKEDVLTWEGQFEVAPAGEPAFDGEQPGEPLPIVAAGQFAATPARVTAAEYRLEIGPREDPYTVTGEGSANIREEISFRVSADGRQIDLDRLDQANALRPQAAGLDRRLAVVRSIVDRVPVPPVKGTIDVQLPAVVAGDTVIREIRAEVEPDRDGWRINNLSLALPGNTVVEARGRLGTGGDFGFTGHMLLASRQPTGFAAWLSGRSSAALRRLRTAGFSADVTLSGHQASFERLEMILDDAVLHGKLQRLAPAGGRPGIVAELAGERINTDDLRAVYALTQSEESGELTDHDLDISLKAGRLEGFGLSAGDVDAHIRVEAGSVLIDRLNAGDFHGAAITGSGRLANPLQRPEGRFSLTVAAEDGAALAALAQRELGDNRLLAAFAGEPALSRGLSAKLEVEARPQGDVSRATLTLSGSMGGTAFALRDLFEGVPARWREATHDLTATLEQDDPGVLARQLALPVSPISPDGPVKVTADLAGSPRQGLQLHLAAHAPETDLSVRGRLAFPGLPGDDSLFSGEPEHELEVTFGTRDIDPWLMMAGRPLPDTGEGHPAAATFSASGRQGVHSFDGLTGNYGDNRFSGALALDLARAGRPKVTGRMRFDTVSAPFVAELLLGAGTVSGDGLTAGLADTEFAGAPLPGFDAELKLEAAVLDLGGGTAAARLSAEATLIDGSLNVQPFSAEWLDGVLAGNLSLRNASGSALVEAQLSLGGADAGKLAALAGFAPVVVGDIDFGVKVEAGGRSLKGLVAALSGSGVVSLTDGRLNGVSTAGLDAILAAADAEGFEIEPETVEPLARQAMLTGATAVPTLSAAFTLVQGRLAARNLRTQDAGGAVDAQGSHDLATGATEIGATVMLDAGKEALTGAEPAASFSWTGTPGAMTVSVDAGALEGFLSLRAFEKEQRQVEILQESVLERQRLRRDTLLTRARMTYREQRRLEELRRLEEVQQRLEAERQGSEEEVWPPPEAPPAAEAATEGAATPVAVAPPADAVGPPAPPASEPSAPPAADPPAAAASAPAVPRAVDVVPVPSPARRRPDFSLFDEIQRKLFGE